MEHTKEQNCANILHQWPQIFSTTGLQPYHYLTAITGNLQGNLIGFYMQNSRKYADLLK